MSHNVWENQGGVPYPVGKRLERPNSEEVPGRVMLDWILKDECKFVRDGSNGRGGGSQQREVFVEAWQCGEYSASGTCNLFWLGLRGDKEDRWTGFRPWGGYYASWSQGVWKWERGWGGINSYPRWKSSSEYKAGCWQISCLKFVSDPIGPGVMQKYQGLTGPKLSGSEEICWVEASGAWRWDKQLCSDL